MSPSLNSPHTFPFSTPSLKMQQRARSIFYIGEECGEAGNEFGTANVEVLSSRPGPGPENAVGLRLLMQQPRQEGRVVMKSEIKLWVLPESNAQQHYKSFQQLGFLKACFLCRKELSLQKDVFMYKGEQGFCSPECRRQQMAADEKRERAVSTKQGRRMNHFARLNARASDSRRLLVATQLTF